MATHTLEGVALTFVVFFKVIINECNWWAKLLIKFPCFFILVSEFQGKQKTLQCGSYLQVNKILLPFIDNLANKSKIVSLWQNVISRLIQVCQIRWWLSLHLFWTEDILFAKTLSKKIKISDS